MPGILLDMDDATQEINNWIMPNGGWEKNALYVSTDHDHYFILKGHFPEAVASFVCTGESHKITP